METLLGNICIFMAYCRPLYSLYKRIEEDDDRIKRLVTSVPFGSTILLLFY